MKIFKVIWTIITKGPAIFTEASELVLQVQASIKTLRTEYLKDEISKDELVKELNLIVGELDDVIDIILKEI